MDSADLDRVGVRLEPHLRGIFGEELRLRANAREPRDSAVRGEVVLLDRLLGELDELQEIGQTARAVCCREQMRAGLGERQ